MIVSSYVKEATKVIGYFCYTSSGSVICDGDACIIAGSEELMQFYLSKMPRSSGKDIIEKTKFGEIISGLKQGGAYAFDKDAYKRFLHLARINKLDGFLPSDFFSEPSVMEMHFIRIQSG